MERSTFDQLLMDVFREMGAHRPLQLLPGKPLSLSEFYGLNILEEREALSQQELADALGLEKSSVSRLVQQLEERGWVSRERDGRDNRVRLLRLTETGTQITAQLLHHMHERHEELWAALTADERAALRQGLSALRRILTTAAQRARMQD